MAKELISKNITLLYYLFTLVAIIGTLGLQAQSGEALLAKLDDEDKESLKALVMYPSDTREAIFVAAQQPAALIKMKKIQDRTAEAFNEIIQSKDKDTQKALWDLTRYPGLMDDLADVGKNNESKAVKVLQDHPEIIRTRALQMYDQQYAALSRMASLKKEGDAAFTTLMKDYSPMTSEALSELLENPEILGLMTESMEVTVTVGDMYRQDPAGTLALAEELNKEVAEENARELSDWRKQLESDPDAMKEFEEATEDFMNEHEEDDVYYSEEEAKVVEGQSQRDVRTNADAQTQEVHHYYHYSYPFWFGYPRWYHFPRWRPYPWRYDWGWSWNVGFGRWNVWGMPSYYFMNWYFGYPFNYFNYPGLACHFSTHYYRHRNSLSGVSRTTQQFHAQNASVIGRKQLDPSDASSRELVKELGRMETSRIAHNRNNPEQELGKREYLALERDKYSTLAARAEEVRPLADDRPRLTREANSTTNGRLAGKGRSASSDRRLPEAQERRPSTGATAPDRSQREGRSTMDRAAEQHRSGWNVPRTPRSNNTGRTTRPKPSAPRAAPSRPAPSRSVPTRTAPSKPRGSSGSGNSRSSGKRNGNR